MRLLLVGSTEEKTNSAGRQQRLRDPAADAAEGTAGLGGLRPRVSTHRKRRLDDLSSPVFIPDEGRKSEGIGGASSAMSRPRGAFSFAWCASPCAAARPVPHPSLQ
jgi:hypothetical protein